MEIDEKLLNHVADVARLELSDDEKKEFIPQLKEIIDTFGKISKVKAEVEPSFQPVDIKPHTRDDVPSSCIPNKTLLKNTEHKDDYFKGPKVI